jgi:hypothetical protein
MKDLVTYMNRMVIGCFMVESGDNEWNYFQEQMSIYGDTI